MQGITKRFPGVIANESVDLDILEGEIHTLLGENGAGKSTLMNILTGIYRADAGRVSIRGRPVHFRSPRDAIARGIGMVHQHFKLILSHTVAENIILGLSGGSVKLNLRDVEAQTARLAEQYGLKVDPRAYIWQLSIGEQQRVEILKILFRGANILILDEPTAVLTPRESREFFETLRAMTAEGHSVVFISHKLDEVMAISHRITVLRGGRVVGAAAPRETNTRELSKMMMGKEVLFDVQRRGEAAGETLLEVEGLTALNDRGLPALRGVGFTVSAGEILGFAGVAGNGQRELAESLTGLRRPTGGKVRLGGREMGGVPAREFIEAGVAYVPADRTGVASVGNLSLSENVVLKQYRDDRFANGPFLDRETIDTFADGLIDRYNIATPGHDTAVRLLSGGNLQKVILAREISSHHRLLIVMSPTRGLDVGATDFIRNTLDGHRREGTAIVLISEDLEELLSLSDRIAVLFDGEIMGTLPVDRAETETLGLMMAGAKRLTNASGEAAAAAPPSPSAGEPR
ncbi:MAG: ABC transporter ATP-binding protein [Nitrospinota bacterium]|nr:ABC transporter ATP-binding protein [Nitrospinota bacterium]